MPKPLTPIQLAVEARRLNRLLAEYDYDWDELSKHKSMTISVDHAGNLYINGRKHGKAKG